MYVPMHVYFLLYPIHIFFLLSLPISSLHFSLNIIMMTCLTRLLSTLGKIRKKRKGIPLLFCFYTPKSQKVNLRPPNHNIYIYCMKYISLSLRSAQQTNIHILILIPFFPSFLAFPTITSRCSSNNNHNIMAHFPLLFLCIPFFYFLSF